MVIKVGQRYKKKGTSRTFLKILAWVEEGKYKVYEYTPEAFKTEVVAGPTSLKNCRRIIKSFIEEEL